MIITKATAIKKLEHPQTQLKEWENSVSKEARKFHLYRHNLLSRINKLLTGKLPFVKKKEVEVLEKRYTQISSIVADLTAFFDNKQKLQDEITQCQQRKFNQGDQKLRYWLAEHCENWQRQLSKLGIDSLRESEFNADDADLTVIQEEFTLHDKAVLLYQKANDILATLDSGIDTAQLVTELPLLKQRLLENNLNDLWLEKLEALVSPLIPLLAKARLAKKQNPLPKKADESINKTPPIKEKLIPEVEEISIDSTLIRQWFSSKAHVPVMRDYTHPLLDELSLSHSAPQQYLAKQEQSSFISPKIIPVDLKSENYRDSDSSSKIVFVDLNS